MSIIDQLSLSKSGPSAFSKVAVNATNDLFSTLLGSEILATINSRDTLAQYQTKSDYSQPYNRPQRGSLEVNDRPKNEIQRAKQPAPYEDDDSYKYDQITENDPIEKEPTITNATERNDDNERSTENVRDDKENFTGNYDKDNSSQSSQGRIVVEKDVISTENKGVESSEIINSESISNGSTDPIAISASSNTNQEALDKNQPSVLTPSTPLGGLATAESTNKAIKSAVDLQAEASTHSIKTPVATNLAASTPGNSTDKPHSIIGAANHANQGVKNSVEGPQPQVDGISSFSRLMVNNTSDIGNIVKGDVGQSDVNSPLTNLEGSQNNLPSLSIDISTSSLLNTSNPKVRAHKPENLANNKLAEIPLTHQTLISPIAASGSDYNSSLLVSQTPTNSQTQIAGGPETSVASNTPLQAQTTASNMVSPYRLGNNVNKVSSNSANTSEGNTLEHQTNLIASLSKDIKINIKDTQTNGVRTTNAVGANIFQAHQVTEAEINPTSQTVPVQRATSALTPPSIVPIENPAPLDVAANSGNKTNGLNVQGNNGVSIGNGATSNNQFSGGNNSPQPNLENNQNGNPRAPNISTPATVSSPSLGSEGASVSRSDGPTGQFSLSQNGNTASTNTTAPIVQKPIAQPATNQVFVQLTKAVQNGQNKITVQLRPEELGRVEVKLDIGGDGRVKAMVMADKPETLDLLQRDSRVLERALQEAGLKTDNNSLSFNLHGKEGNGQAYLSSNAEANSNGQNHAEQENQDDEAINEVEVSASAIGTTPEGAINVLA
jgi:flagellar hook-length control protein FliK